MTKRPRKKRIKLVTGLSGAGKSTVLRTLEDMGWESVDNFPIRLVGRLLDTPPAGGREDEETPLAIGFDSRTRGFEPAELVRQIKRLQTKHGFEISTLFLNCAEAELERRYAETRRRHPLALDRPASDGIAEERELFDPVRRWAEMVIDTTHLSEKALQDKIRYEFSGESHARSTITLMSFGFARGVPHNIDLIFDMRFLRNPYWQPDLKELSGLDAEVAEYVRGDASFDEAIDKIADLLLFLLPRYESQGKAYVNIGFGCTGGRHRSVFIAEEMRRILGQSGFQAHVMHRNLSARPIDALEGQPAAGGKASSGEHGEESSKEGKQ